MGFELGDELLDRVEIGRIGRQVAQFGASGLDDLPHRLAFVCRQIVHHDDVARRQGGDQAPPQVFEEDRPGHRAIDDEGRGDAVLAQPGQEGENLPVPPGHSADEASAAFGAPAQPRHVGRGPGFIEEDQSGRVEIGLCRNPGGARRGDVRPLLLAGVHDFF